MNRFITRHVGINTNMMTEMLKVCNYPTLTELIKDSVSIDVKSTKLKNIPPKLTVEESSNKLKKLLSKNKKNTSLIGMGYHNTFTPDVIKRHVLENPKWYTAYTPYQAEISQGRLEAQYNYQTVIKELTGLEITNASLLDEASTSSEVLNMCYNYSKKKKKTFIVSDDLHPQILEVMKTKAKILNINLQLYNFKEWELNFKLDSDTTDFEDICGIMFSYPNTYGDIYIPYTLINYFKDTDVTLCANTDIVALTKIIEPGAIGIDICFGTAQRLGIPMYYGGPHPAFLSTTQNYTRLLPGRIIGKSIDSLNKDCYRLGLQTREQHIRKDKATSNICTSQSLLASMVGFYCYYMGKEGLYSIFNDIHKKTQIIDYYLTNLGIKNKNQNYFDTLYYDNEQSSIMYSLLKKNDIILRKIDANRLCLSVDETITLDIIYKLLKLIYDYHGVSLDYYDVIKKYNSFIAPNYNLFKRYNTHFLNCDKFSNSKTETELLRYIYQLTKKDYTLCEGMIPLGSCTMKLNASYQLNPLSWETTQNFHPYLPKEYVKGYHDLIHDIGTYLKDITGFNHVSFQSNSGAMGEYTGLLCIKKYHKLQNNKHKILCLIPKSAHGTNFASSQLAGFKPVSYDDNLNLNDFEDLVKKNADNLGCLMITYPGTNGVFQKDIKEICTIIHKYGGLVYLDGANMNAQVGLVKPEHVGADICHLNLHKTFCIPHGGGGPGLGPILCNDKLGNFLPTNIMQLPKNDTSIGMITGSNWSSASLLTIPYLYISSMGGDGLKHASEIAVLNANYLKDRLKDYYTIIDVNENDRVAHEFIIDTTEFKNYNITDVDISKRLIDYSFHPPTMSWPRQNVLMFEPTESENKPELDRLVNALISIRKEIDEISISENYTNNSLKNAPHSLDLISDWKYDYSMDKAFFPCESLKQHKFWPTHGRINDIEGDKRLLTKV